MIDNNKEGMLIRGASASDVSAPNDITLGDIHVSPSHNTLTANGNTITLQPKVMAVLHYLAQHQSRVISQEELIEQVWRGRIVTHGSVQKSINSLRKAFTELIGNNDIIAHYSKRGYQLTLQPKFPEAHQPIHSNEPTEHSNTLTVTKKSNRQRKMVVSVALVIVIVLCVLLLRHLQTQIPDVERTHHQVFSTVNGYTHETGHERSPEPHPNNQHIAYIREQFNPEKVSGNKSHLIIRNANGEDWQIASSQGNWIALAWSPQGQHLVAIETNHHESQARTPDFYAKTNDLYTFHIFSLDLEQQRLIEKHLLSQWQGRIASVTWWDETTLEFVAAQGAAAGYDRYRYAVQDQALSVLETDAGITHPLLSTIHDKRTAVASQNKRRVRIDFLNDSQTSFASWPLDAVPTDISWIPDGSGVVVFSQEEQQLTLLYLNGEQLTVPLDTAKDKILSRPRFSADGKAIYYAEEKLSSTIWQLGLDQHKTKLTENTAVNYAAVFSNQGNKIVYASVRNNQIHLWLVENGQERQLTSVPKSKTVHNIVWSPNDNFLVYRAGTEIFIFDITAATERALLEQANNTDPIAFYPDTSTLLAIKQTGEVRNLWRINTSTQEQKQLTFGSLGSAIEFSGDVYFQYIGSRGLWILRGATDTLEQISTTLNENSKLLKAGAKGVYLVTGGKCRESAVYYLDFSSDILTTYLEREEKAVSTTGFHAERGLLQTDCVLAEANILRLE